jgi:hypothetical protein
MQSRDPEEFERLQKMHSENPEAFREALREKVRTGRAATLERRFPQLYEAVMSLPPKDREWAISRLLEGGPQGPGRDASRFRSPEMEALENKAAELARSYRRATGEDEKARIRRELRAVLAEGFDRREELRTREVQEMQRRMAALAGELENRKAKRDEIIDRRLKELTEGEKAER